MRKLAVISGAMLALVIAVAAVSATRADTATEGFVPGTNCPTETSNQLAAQTVPAASLVPCISLLGGRWSVSSESYTDDGTTVTMVGADAPEISWDVELATTCDTSQLAAGGRDGEASVFEREEAEGSTFEREQRLVFDGGCVTSTLEMPMRFDRQLVLESADEALLLVERAALDAQVRDQTDGDLGLDP